MALDVDRRIFVLQSLATVLAATGCGTVLHPERRGQPSGRLDWGIVALDAVGLFFFFIPGVIAFAVDFATGAIYLPPGEYTDQTAPVHDNLAKITVPKSQLNQSGIEAVVSQQTGQPIELSSEKCRTTPLQKLKDFWPLHRQHFPEHA